MRLFIILLSVTLSIGFQSAKADSPIDQVREVIQQYIDSSSHSQSEPLIQAFHPDATLYLTGANGFARYDRQQYAALFAAWKVASSTVASAKSYRSKSLRILQRPKPPLKSQRTIAALSICSY